MRVWATMMNVRYVLFGLVVLFKFVLFGPHLVQRGPQPFVVFSTDNAALEFGTQLLFVQALSNEDELVLAWSITPRFALGQIPQFVHALQDERRVVAYTNRSGQDRVTLLGRWRISMDMQATSISFSLNLSLSQTHNVRC